MPFPRLPFDAALGDYETHSAQLLQGHATGDSEALSIFHRNHPRFVDDRMPWAPKRLSKAGLTNATLSADDARLTLARWYCFRDWPALAGYAEAINRDKSIFQFESAVEAVIKGEFQRLESLLPEHPELVRARSTRVTKYDPPVHAATLLHYVSANGVEDYRQKAPPNASAMAIALLRMGADPNATANFYGGKWRTLGLVASSSHPSQAGVQTELIDVLVDFGASLQGGDEDSPLLAALVHGYRGAAEALVRRGAPIDRLDIAAGLGRLAKFAVMLPTSSPQERHQALALAAQHGHEELVRLLIDAGEDVNRFNPPGFHRHATPLHQAVLAGQEAVVRLLVARGARLDIQDKLHDAVPLGWADHNGQRDIAEFLRSLPD